MSSSELQAILPEMIGWRHGFHRLPELAYEEHRTAATVADLLRGFGIDEIATGIGGTGVIGVIRNGDGPSVGLRADMDALPIAEQTGAAYRSAVAGVMHACGHDGHMTMLLGAARYLAATRRFAGRVVLIFQPAEEGRAGAKAMIEDGVLDRYPFDKVFALHNIPGMPAGEIAVSPGAVMAAVDRFDIVVRGRGGHAAMPHLNRDPVLAAAALVMGLQSIVSRDRDPLAPAVVTVTRISAGEADNATPAEAGLRGNVRYLEADGSAVFRGHIERIARGTAETYGVSADVDYLVGRPADGERGGGIGARPRGRRHLVARGEPCGSPDSDHGLRRLLLFPQRAARRLRLPRRRRGRPSLHSPDYDFNDDILVPGAAFLSRVAEAALGR